MFIQPLSVLAVLESKRLSIRWRCSWRYRGRLGRCRFGRGCRCGCRRRCALVGTVVTISSDTTSSTSVGDTFFSVLLSGASDGGALFVDKGEGEALSAGRAPNYYELAPHTLSELAVNARVLTAVARGVCRKLREVGILLLSILTVLKRERLVLASREWVSRDGNSGGKRGSDESGQAHHD